MQIKETNDDVKLQALNKPRGLAAEPRKTQQVDASEPARPPQPGSKQMVKRRKDRRKGDRRKQKRKVLLDTRVARDRRTEARRQEDEPAETNSGVDLNC